MFREIRCSGTPCSSTSGPQRQLRTTLSNLWPTRYIIFIPKITFFYGAIHKWRLQNKGGGGLKSISWWCHPLGNRGVDKGSWGDVRKYSKSCKRHFSKDLAETLTFLLEFDFFHTWSFFRTVRKMSDDGSHSQAKISMDKLFDIFAKPFMVIQWCPIKMRIFH